MVLCRLLTPYHHASFLAFESAALPGLLCSDSVSDLQHHHLLMLPSPYRDQCPPDRNSLPPLHDRTLGMLDRRLGTRAVSFRQVQRLSVDWLMPAGEMAGAPNAAAVAARQVNIIDPQHLHPGHMVGEGAYGKARAML